MGNQIKNKSRRYGDEPVNGIVDDFLFIQILKRVKKNIYGTKIANFIELKKAIAFFNCLIYIKIR